MWRSYVSLFILLFVCSFVSQAKLGDMYSKENEETKKELSDVLKGDGASVRARCCSLPVQLVLARTAEKPATEEHPEQKPAPKEEEQKPAGELT